MVDCLYKVIAKILASWMNRVMSGLVRETQSAFVSGRKILDGALIVNEAMWWLKRLRSKVVLSKLDFHNAYDIVN